jgi:hypothetical protein
VVVVGTVVAGTVGVVVVGTVGAVVGAVDAAAPAFAQSSKP